MDPAVPADPFLRLRVRNMPAVTFGTWLLAGLVSDGGGVSVEVELWREYGFGLRC